jgi:uncharacterized membrane protein YccC
LSRAPSNGFNGTLMAIGMVLHAVVLNIGWGSSEHTAWIQLATAGFMALSVADTFSARQAKWGSLWPAAAGCALIAAAWVAGAAWHGTELALVVTVAFAAPWWGAWGKRGLAVGFAWWLMLIFLLSGGRGSQQPAALPWVIEGVVAALIWSMLMSRLSSRVHRAIALRQALSALEALLSAQSQWLGNDRHFEHREQAERGLLEIVRLQAALTDAVQQARDHLYGTARRQKGGRQLRPDVKTLWQALQVRDAAVLCTVDLDLSGDIEGMALARQRMSKALAEAARRVREVALAGDAFDWKPAPPHPPTELERAALRPWERLAVDRSVHLLDQVEQLAQARASAPTVMPYARWKSMEAMTTPTGWPWPTLKAAVRGHSPILRLSMRTTLAAVAAWSVAQWLPWHSHSHWLLLTVAVVMRGSLAQTLARRNARVLGTLGACVLAMGWWWWQPPVWGTLLATAIAMAVAHSFLLIDYRVTAAAGTFMALLQAHAMGNHDTSLWSWWGLIGIRMADTLIGAGLAWLFSMVLPAWERRQLPETLQNMKAALIDLARQTLTDARSQQNDRDFAVARRAVHDQFWALQESLVRAQAEPRRVAVQVPLLEESMVHAHRLTAHLSVVRRLLNLHARDLPAHVQRESLRHARDVVETSLNMPVRLAVDTSIAAWPSRELALESPNTDLPEDQPVKALERHIRLVEWHARCLQQIGQAMNAHLQRA